MKLAMRTWILALLVISGGLYPNTARAAYLNPGNSKWGGPTLGAGATVTWSLMPDGTDVRRRPPYFPPEEPFIFHDFWQGTSNLNSIYAQLDLDPTVGKALFRTALQNAFATWAKAANLTFIEVTDNGLPLGSPGSYAGQVGDIRIGAFSLASPFDAFAAQAFEPPGGSSPGALYLTDNSPTTFGDITLNTNAVFSVFTGLKEGDYYGGFPNDLQNLLTHEIGHALGLLHPEADGLDPGEEFAIMRASAPLTIQRTLAADDILGIQTLYGAPSTTATPGPSSFALGGIALMFGIGAVRRRMGK